MNKPNAHRLDSLQALRGVAALAVLLFHVDTGARDAAWSTGTGAFLGHAFGFGWIGVDCFFCLSGFVIAWVHSRDVGQPERAGLFAWKRFFRIYPPYIVLVVVKAAFYLAAGSPGSSATPFPLRLVNAIFLLPGPHGVYGEMIVGVAWTLSFEALFYVLFCGAIVMGKTAARIGVAAWIAGIVFYQLHRAGDGRSAVCDFLLNPYDLEFLAGVAMARLAQFAQPRWLAWAAVAVAAAILAGGLALHLPWSGQELISRGVIAAGFGLLLFGLVRIEADGMLRVPRLLSLLGAASYSIYLAHEEVEIALFKANARFGWFPEGAAAWQGWLVAVAGAGLLGGIAYYFAVEKPLRVRCARFLRDRNARPD